MLDLDGSDSFTVSVEEREGDKMECEDDRGSVGSMDEEAEINEHQFAESMGYVSDREKKAVPIHNVPFTGPNDCVEQKQRPKTGPLFLSPAFLF